MPLQILYHLYALGSSVFLERADFLAGKKETPARIRFRMRAGVCLYDERTGGYIGYLIAACAAARRAIGTRNGEQET